MILVPPLQFSLVAPNIYRSGYPNKKNFPFLKKLRLKSIIYLADDDEYLEDNRQFTAQEEITLFHIKIAGNKEPFTEIKGDDIAFALTLVLDQRNHPILIHCNKGKYRVGCLVGCLRKLQDWSLAAIFQEYQQFTGTSLRIADQEFIEIFNSPVKYDPKHVPKNLLVD